MLARSLVLFASFLVGAGFVARAERPEAVPPRSEFKTLPMVLGDWRGTQGPPLQDDILAVLGVDDYLTRAYYKSRNEGVGIYIGYYGSQRQGDTMHSPQNCLPGAGWEFVSHSQLPLTVPVDVADSATREIVVNRYLIRKGLEQQIVLYWYQSHDRVVASEYWAKFYLIRDAMRLNRTDGSLIRITAPVVEGAGEAGAQETAVSFVRELFPRLGTYIPK